MLLLLLLLLRGVTMHVMRCYAQRAADTALYSGNSYTTTSR